LSGSLFVLPGAHDALLLLALALACTLLPFTLSLVALRHMSAFAAQLAVNLEPVYAIVLAIVLLREQHQLTPQFYLGVAIILGAVLLYPMLARPRPLQHPEMLGTAEAKGTAE
jgi:drug/metabolite transporter (DMT)-like permease